MCLMGDAHRNCEIIGSMDKKKHEKLLQDGQVSITVICTRSVGRFTGPTVFLLKGEKKKKHYTDEFLVRTRCALGSTIIMIENVYMTNEAWEEASKAIVPDYRQIPCVKNNPQWALVEFLVGVKTHEDVLPAHQLCDKNHIIY